MSPTVKTSVENDQNEQWSRPGVMEDSPVSPGSACLASGIVQAANHNSNTWHMYLTWAGCIGKQQLGTDGWVGNSSSFRVSSLLK